MNWKFLGGMRFLLPACLVTIMAAEGLAGYEQPVYSAPERGVSQMDLLTNIGETLPSSEPAAETVKMEETTPAAAGSVDVPDGIYEGSANGYGGPIRVRVTVAGGKMTAIEILSAAGEDPAFLNRAKRVIDAMLTGQTADVDTVSEATYSSRGIIAAVKNALYHTEDTNPTAAQAGAANQPAPQPEKVKEASSYKDGTYTGSARGFGGMITVEVVVKGGKIHSIRVVSAPGEGKDYLGRASTLIAKMIKKQTTNVDTVSGATFSSTGLINAVRNALKKAGGDSSQTVTRWRRSKKKATEKTPSTGGADTEAGKWADGTYEGSAPGFGGMIRVRVTVSGGKITAVDILDASGETPEYLKKAKGLLTEIVKQQSADLDAVSGATYSSNGILGAVQEALRKAAQAAGIEVPAKESSAQAPAESPLNESSRSEEQTKEQQTPQKQTVDDSEYADGVFTGSGEGFEGPLTVQVTLQAGKITEVKLLEWVDDEPYITMAGGILKAIEAANSTDVDVISGASFSSRGILRAVNDALEKSRAQKAKEMGETAESGSSESGTAETSSAAESESQSGEETRPSGGSEDESGSGAEAESSSDGSEEAGKETETSAETSASETQTGSEESGQQESESVYTDGVYEASAACWDFWDVFDEYTITGTVEIHGDRIVDIRNLSFDGDSSNQKFFQKAVDRVVPQILTAGNADGVDAASGATCSSDAIVELCRSAMEKARR